jgi:hypothetical protein
MAMSLLTLGCSLPSVQSASLLETAAARFKTLLGAVRSVAQRAMLIVTLTMGMSACMPSHNWREMVVDQGGVVVMFPSKPDRLTRSIDLNGLTLNMTMVGSKIDRTAYTVAWVDLPSPALAQQALENMRLGMLKNIAYADSPLTPNASAGLRTLPVQVLTRGTNAVHLATLVETPIALSSAASHSDAGRLANRPAMRALFVAHGLRAWQAVAVGPALDPEHAKLFTDSFKLLAD